MILRFFLQKNAKYAKQCSVKVAFNENEILFDGIIDTGNSVSQILGDGEIIIVDEGFIKSKIDKFPSNRYRCIPVKTVSGTALLEGYRFDKAEIKFDKTEKTLINPVLAFSKTPLSDGDYNAIINPRSIL